MPLPLTIDASAGDDGVMRHIILHGTADDAENFAAAIEPGTGSPLKLLRDALSPGWTDFFTCHAVPSCDPVLGVVRVGGTISRDDMIVDLTRAFWVGDPLPDAYVMDIVSETRD